MSIGKSLAKILVFAVLQIGALGGVPMRPEEIEKVMKVMHDTKIEWVVKQDDD